MHHVIYTYICIFVFVLKEQTGIVGVKCQGIAEMGRFSCVKNTLAYTEGLWLGSLLKNASVSDGNLDQYVWFAQEIWRYDEIEHGVEFPHASINTGQDYAGCKKHAHEHFATPKHDPQAPHMNDTYVLYVCVYTDIKGLIQQM